MDVNTFFKDITFSYGVQLHKWEYYNNIRMKKKGYYNKKNKPEIHRPIDHLANAANNNLNS